MSCKQRIMTPSCTARKRATITIDQLLREAGFGDTTDGDSESTKTAAGWCLREGLITVASVHNGSLLPLIEHHGVPALYKQQGQTLRHVSSCPITPSPLSSQQPQQSLSPVSSPSFDSLCRLIGAQCVSHYAARAAYQKLLDLCHGNITPETLMTVIQQRQRQQDDESLKHFQSIVGLTLAKATAMHDLARHFIDGHLSESFLQTSDDTTIRTALLNVKGIGTWTCDVFLLFSLQRSNILPLGDLGVRKGLATQFNLVGSANNKGLLCPKKDAKRVAQFLSPFEPYLSLVTLYMWRVVDAPVPPVLSPRDKEQEPPCSILVETPTRGNKRKRNEEPHLP